ncbi:uncharacterized protein LOC111989583 isoform X2 [Quercus suber]|uniref:uncharacterized protein LOC111989583 isoform X2 n=1 Tax=Quercus suber TaxID=58331 RepID=UPI0032DF01CC
MAIFLGANSRRILSSWIQVMPWNETQVLAASLPNLPLHGPHPILPLQVGLEGLCLLFFPDKTPKSNGKNDHRTCCLLGERSKVRKFRRKGIVKGVLTVAATRTHYSSAT